MAYAQINYNVSEFNKDADFDLMDWNWDCFTGLEGKLLKMVAAEFNDAIREGIFRDDGISFDLDADEDGVRIGLCLPALGQDAWIAAGEEDLLEAFGKALQGVDCVWGEYSAEELAEAKRGIKSFAHKLLALCAAPDTASGGG